MSNFGLCWTVTANKIWTCLSAYAYVRDNSLSGGSSVAHSKGPTQNVERELAG